MATTRKNIDFPDELVQRMDAIRAERRTTYNELIIAAVEAWLAPQAPEQTDRSSMAQQIWGLESFSQKTAERLDQLEQAVQVLQEAVLLIEQKLPQTPAEPEPVEALTPLTDDQQVCEDMLASIRTPPLPAHVPVAERKQWWGVPPWER